MCGERVGAVPHRQRHVHKRRYAGALHRVGAVGAVALVRRARHLAEPRHRDPEIDVGAGVVADVEGSRDGHRNRHAALVDVRRRNWLTEVDRGGAAFGGVRRRAESEGTGNRDRERGRGGSGRRHAAAADEPHDERQDEERGEDADGERHGERRPQNGGRPLAEEHAFSPIELTSADGNEGRAVGEESDLRQRERERHVDRLRRERRGAGSRGHHAAPSVERLEANGGNRRRRRGRWDAEVYRVTRHGGDRRERIAGNGLALKREADELADRLAAPRDVAEVGDARAVNARLIHQPERAEHNLVGVAEVWQRHPDSRRRASGEAGRPSEALPQRRRAGRVGAFVERNLRRHRERFGCGNINREGRARWLVGTVDARTGEREDPLPVGELEAVGFDASAGDAVGDEERRGRRAGTVAADGNFNVALETGLPRERPRQRDRERHAHRGLRAHADGIELVGVDERDGKPVPEVGEQVHRGRQVDSVLAEVPHREVARDRLASPKRPGLVYNRLGDVDVGEVGRSCGRGRREKEGSCGECAGKVLGHRRSVG